GLRKPEPGPGTPGTAGFRQADAAGPDFVREPHGRRLGAHHPVGRQEIQCRVRLVSVQPEVRAAAGEVPGREVRRREETADARLRRRVSRAGAGPGPAPGGSWERKPWIAH